MNDKSPNYVTVKELRILVASLRQACTAIEQQANKMEEMKLDGVETSNWSSSGKAAANLMRRFSENLPGAIDPATAATSELFRELSKTTETVRQKRAEAKKKATKKQSN